MTRPPGPPLFTGLRLRLTGLYLLASLALVALVGGGAYGLLSNFFSAANDDALNRKMASELATQGLRPPPDNRAGSAPAVSTRPSQNDREAIEHSDDANREALARQRRQDEVNPDLLAVFVMPLDAAGNVIGRPLTQTQITPNRAAFAAALQNGVDWRTVALEGGGRARLYSYRAESGPVAVLQLGRSLSDQDQILNYLLLSLLAFGAATAVLVGAASWWLAGRSIEPARAAWAKQQAFVASASHELRAPLTLLRASAETVRDELPAGAESQRGLLDDVLGETDHMARLVDDLLTLSRLDAGKLALQLERVDVGALVTETARQMERLAAERGLVLTAHAADGLMVNGDATRLRQIILNGLDNALRYTPRGGRITVGAESRPGRVDIVIADTGIGIGPEDLGHVFDRFYRADSTRREGITGSGLGLSIVRALADAHHGKVAISSAPGEGTRLSVSLPAANSG